MHNTELFSAFRKIRSLRQENTRLFGLSKYFLGKGLLHLQGVTKNTFSKYFFKYLFKVQFQYFKISLIFVSAKKFQEGWGKTRNIRITLKTCDFGGKYLYMIRCLLWKCRLIFLPVLKVFDEPLGESNTERRVKISFVISKEGT